MTLLCYSTPVEEVTAPSSQFVTTNYESGEGYYLSPNNNSWYAGDSGGDESGNASNAADAAAADAANAEGATGQGAGTGAEGQGVE